MSEARQLAPVVCGPAGGGALWAVVRTDLSYVSHRCFSQLRQSHQVVAGGGHFHPEPVVPRQAFLPV